MGRRRGWRGEHVIREHNLVRDEAVVADAHAPVRGDDRADDCAIVPDLNFTVRSQIEERTVIDPAVAADAHAAWSLASIMQECERAVAPASLADSHVGGERV